MGRLRQFNRMKAVFHAMHSGIEQSVSGLSGRAAIGVTICWMSGIGRGSRIDSRSRVTQISLKRPAQTISTHVLPAVWERHDPAAARSQNEALHADAHVALQALPQNHAQMRRSNAGTGRAGRNT